MLFKKSFNNLTVKLYEQAQAAAEQAEGAEGAQDAEQRR